MQLRPATSHVLKLESYQVNKGSSQISDAFESTGPTSLHTVHDSHRRTAHRGPSALAVLSRLRDTDGGGVLALLQMPLSHTGTPPGCDGEGNLLVVIGFSLLLYSRRVSFLTPEAVFISKDRNQAGVSTC